MFVILNVAEGEVKDLSIVVGDPSVALLLQDDELQKTLWVDVQLYSHGGGGFYPFHPTAHHIW